MNIVESRKLEDCFDGSTVYGYRFDGNWTSETIHLLSSLGTLEYYPEFPRPFFRVLNDAGLNIRGVEGESNCRVIFPRQDKDIVKREFEGLFPLACREAVRRAAQH